MGEILLLNLKIFQLLLILPIIVLDVIDSNSTYGGSLYYYIRIHRIFSYRGFYEFVYLVTSGALVLALYRLKYPCKDKKHENSRINKSGFFIDIVLAISWLAASLAWLSPLYFNKLYICYTNQNTTQSYDPMLCNAYIASSILDFTLFLSFLISTFLYKKYTTKSESNKVLNS
ncbi:hypothetical protein C2G38_439064 [Gigaspora rosea]|uniref:Uncharacterized protein n=1 Tax=Gigaspora rosea TaxID=44941 RepID=A0A397UAZ7_9GLOM|nr:hypothetical protein C2G38_439064 [Gigaspora rosea]